MEPNPQPMRFPKPHRLGVENLKGLAYFYTPKHLTMNYYQPLEAGGIYHIVSRANGNEKLFIEQENYLFLQCYNLP